MAATAALMSLTVIGCGAGRRAKARGSTLGAFEILDAQKVATQVEQWRVQKAWSQINATLSTVAFTPSQRQLSPSFPFTTSSKPIGDLTQYALFSAIEDPDYHDPKTGVVYQMVAIYFTDQNALIDRPVRTKLTMMKEANAWRLAGVMSTIDQ